MQDSLKHMPPGRWAFDEDVADCFEDMLARSVPQYEEMRRLVLGVTTRYAQSSYDILDLGCSRGRGMADIVDSGVEFRKMFGCESSAPMVQAARARFTAQSPGRVFIEHGDITERLPNCLPSVVLSVLTLQFVPLEKRQMLLDSICSIMAPGGVFVLVEKVTGASAKADRDLVAEYYNLKKRNGFSLASIEAKKRALEGVLVPLTGRENEARLTSAGFQDIECFWRWCNFAAWFAFKPARIPT